MSSPSYSQLAAVAARHGGSFDRAAAREAGFSDHVIRRRVETGAWVSVLPGVFRAAETPVTRNLRLHAGLSWLGPHSFASHGTAAARYGFAADPLKTWCSVPLPVTVLPPPWLEVVRTRHPSYQTLADGLRIAQPARAMADLGMVYGRRELAASLATGVQSGRLVVPDVLAQVDLLAGRAGTADMRAVLAEFDPAFESILSIEMFALMESAGLRGFEPSVKVGLQTGSFAVLDAADKELRLGFEADGFAYHGTKEQQAADKARDVLLGHVLYRVARFTTDQIRREAAQTKRMMQLTVSARAREIGAARSA